MPLEVGVFGATGYTGLELIRLLGTHPQAHVRFATSESGAGTSLRKSWPLAPNLELVTAAEAPVEEVQCVFLCLPHTESARVAAQAASRGVRVIDLSADLRLDDPSLYQQWYGSPHPAPELLPVPYGLPELGRDRLRQARLIANPGCYATATLLGLYPLAAHHLLASVTPIIVDAKSGVTGAGRTPKPHILFGEVHSNFSPYSMGRTHRHIPEIEQALQPCGIESGRLVFSPHLLPTDRGIVATIYVQVRDMEAAQQAFRALYDGEPLVQLLAGGELATLAHIVRTPRAVISLTPATETTLIVVSALDNLLKGAASQAIQNFNLMWGFTETTGLVATEGVYA
jgi:N-acetyl-gamma-glutamyl-phosphate reductase